MITEADLEAHIAWQQSPHQRGGWTPTRDHALAAALCAGRGLGRAAEALGVTPAEALARWDALFPREARGVRLQAALLRILKGNREAARLRVVE